MQFAGVVNKKKHFEQKKNNKQTKEQKKQNRTKVNEHDR